MIKIGNEKLFTTQRAAEADLMPMTFNGPEGQKGLKNVSKIRSI